MEFRNRISNHLGRPDEINYFSDLSYLSHIDVRCNTEVQQAIKEVYKDTKGHLEMLREDPVYFSTEVPSSRFEEQKDYFRGLRDMVDYIAEEHMRKHDQALPIFYTCARGTIDKVLQKIDGYYRRRKTFEERNKFGGNA